MARPPLRALAIHAGPRALAHLRQHGLAPGHVAAVSAAAGGPKGLILNGLDRFLFGTWFAGRRAPLHLAGASIGAWRMALACLDDAGPAFERFAHDYIHQPYDKPAEVPWADFLSDVFAAMFRQWVGAREAEVLGHPAMRLHVVTSHGRGLLRREHRLATPLGYAAAFLGNAVHRRALGGLIDRVVFSDPRDAWPFALDDFPTTTVPLTPANLHPAALASASIPFWVRAVHDIPGAPRGAYWDGGITDYHLHWPYAAIAPTAMAPLVLYPHFQATLVPGWLDKAWKRRHRATAWLDNLLLLSPRPEWVAQLPGGKLPDRNDVKRYGADAAARQAVWRGATAQAAALADEFEAWLSHGTPTDVVQPL
jgi:hypothetical protein